MAFLTESTLRGPVLFKSRCTFSCVDTLCHNFELNFGFLDEFERKAPLGGRMRNWIIWMPFQIVNFLGILKKFTGIIDDSMRVVQERVLNSKTCQKMNYNHRYSCIHVDGLAQRSFNPQKVAMWHEFFHYSAIVSCITLYIWKSVDCYFSNKVYRDILRNFYVLTKTLKCTLYTLFET